MSFFSLPSIEDDTLMAAELGYYGLCALRNFKSERVAVELFRTLDVVEKIVDETGFEPRLSSTGCDQSR